MHKLKKRKALKKWFWIFLGLRISLLWNPIVLKGGWFCIKTNGGQTIFYPKKQPTF